MSRVSAYSARVRTSAGRLARTLVTACARWRAGPPPPWLESMSQHCAAAHHGPAPATPSQLTTTTGDSALSCVRHLRAATIMLASTPGLLLLEVTCNTQTVHYYSSAIVLGGESRKVRDFSDYCDHQG